MKNGNPAYRKSTLGMQDVGLLGEYAVAHWLGQHHPEVLTIADSQAGRQYGQGDLAVLRNHGSSHESIRTGDRVTFEVKTSRYKDWRHYGRSLDADQLRRSTASAYIWCVVSSDLPTESVLLMGWLPTEAIRTADAGTATVEHDRPHWRVTAPMRAMGELPDWWESCPQIPF